MFSYQSDNERKIEQLLDQSLLFLKLKRGDDGLKKEKIEQCQAQVCLLTNSGFILCR